MSERLQSVDSENIELLGTIAEMNNKIAKTVVMLNTALKGMKTEIRATEFQSRYYCHINVIQQFVTALTAVLFKHLQSTDKIHPILADIRKLARLFETSGSEAPR